MNNSIKKKASIGVLWNAVDKIIAQGGQFLISIVLARLILPEDFGLMAIMAVFIQISQVFIEGGLGIGLIQKKNRTDVDFSTVFVSNLGLSIIFVFVLFVLAPFIADFYNLPSVKGILRILSLNLIIGSFTIIQITKLTIDVDFKNLAKVNVLSMLLSGAIAIFLAFNDFGIYALVVQNLVKSLLTFLFLLLIKKAKYNFSFSLKSFKELYGFSIKLLTANVYSQILTNLYNLVIGKFYAVNDLGYYSRARTLTDVTSGTMSSVIQQVSFPILSLLQDDREQLKAAYSKTIRLTAFVIFPSMVMISLLSEPIIKLLFNDEWLMVIPLLKWMAFTRILYPISVVNLNVLNVNGRSDLYLKLELIKFPVIVIPMIITMFISLKALVIGQVVASFISFFINAYYPGRIYNYGALKQLKDLREIIFSTVLMALIVSPITLCFESMLLKFLFGGGMGLLSYLIFTRILKCKELDSLIQMFKKYM